jgi:hypothetical protein
VALAGGASLTALAHADSSFTLKCQGLQSWIAATGAPAPPARVSNYYTFHLSDAGGQVYGWHEHAWSTLTEADPQSYTVQESVAGMSWRLAIGRADGAWNEVWSGRQHTVSISGHCKPVDLREPPAAAPAAQ